MRIAHFLTITTLLLPAVALAQIGAETRRSGSSPAASKPVADAAAKERLRQALQNDSSYRDITAQITSGNEADSQKVAGLLEQREQRAQAIAKENNIDLGAIRGSAKARAAPRSGGKHLVTKASQGGGEPAAQSGPSSGIQLDRYTLTSFPEHSDGTGACADVFRVSDMNWFILRATTPSCDWAESWYYGTINIAHAGEATAYVKAEPYRSSVYARASKGSSARSDLGFRFSGGPVNSVCVTLSVDAPRPTLETVGLGSETAACKLGQIPAGTLRAGPWLGASILASPDDPAADAYATALSSRPEITIVVSRPASSGSSASRFEQAPAMNSTSCPAPIIATPTENKSYDKGPLILSVKAPNTATVPPGNTVKVSIDRVGGGNAALFDMPLDGTEDLGPILGQNGDGTFPIDASATYKITATINPKSGPIPVTCTPSSPRTFKIVRPSQPRKPRIAPDSPPNMIDERKPNPTTPPPVEMQQMNQGR
jgi:hypothetical protein